VARAGALENVRANLPSIRDDEWLKQMEQKLRSLAS
jgi:formiminotetrahydrofolate cyclodeaminase